MWERSSLKLQRCTWLHSRKLVWVGGFDLDLYAVERIDSALDLTAKAKLWYALWQLGYIWASKYNQIRTDVWEDKWQFVSNHRFTVLKLPLYLFLSFATSWRACRPRCRRRCDISRADSHRRARHACHQLSGGRRGPWSARVPAPRGGSHDLLHHRERSRSHLRLRHVHHLLRGTWHVARAISNCT